MTASPQGPEPSPPRRPTRARSIPLLALAPPRRRSAGSVLLSLVLHALLVAFIISPWAYFHPNVPAGLIAGFLGGGGGGSGGSGSKSVAYISVAPPPAPTPPAPVPAPVHVETPPPTQDAPPVPVPAAPVDTAPSAPVAQAGPGQGQADGPGKGPGSGGGQGGGAGGGIGTAEGPGAGGGGGAGRPAIAKQLVFPYNDKVPKALRGREITVTLWISATGQVLRVTETPPLEASDFRRRFEAAMAAYTFEPARDSLGVAVPSTYPMVITLGTR